MSKFKKSNKLGVEQIFVVKGDLAAKTGAFVNATTALNIADGQLGVLSWDHESTTRSLGNFLVAGDNSAQVQQIKLVNGTPASADTTQADVWEVNDKAYLESGIINKQRINYVSTKRAAYARYGAQALTNFGTPVNNQEYKAYLRLTSVRKDKFYGDSNEVIHAIVPAVNFTNLGITNTKDYVLQKLGTTFNGYSRAVAGGTKGQKNFVVLGVKAAGLANPGTGIAFGTVTLTSTAVSAVSVTTQGTGYLADNGTPNGTIKLLFTGGSPTTSAVVTVAVSGGTIATQAAVIVNGGTGYSSAPTASIPTNAATIGNISIGSQIGISTNNSVTSFLTADGALVSSLARLVQDSTGTGELTNSSSILPFNYTVPGASANFDTLIVVGLPHIKAKTYDDIEMLQCTPEINLASGFLLFSTPVTVTRATASEGTGQGWKWNILWNHRTGLDTHTKQIVPLNDWFAPGKSYIDDNTFYHSYTIDHFDTENTLTGEKVSPKRVHILFKAAVNASFPNRVSDVVTNYAAGNPDFPFILVTDAGVAVTNNQTVTNNILSAWLEHVRANGNYFNLTGDAVAASNVYLPA